MKYGNEECSHDINKEVLQHDHLVESNQKKKEEFMIQRKLQEAMEEEPKMQKELILNKKKQTRRKIAKKLARDRNKKKLKLKGSQHEATNNNHQKIESANEESIVNKKMGNGMKSLGKVLLGLGKNKLIYKEDLNAINIEDISSDSSGHQEKEAEREINLSMIEKLQNERVNTKTINRRQSIETRQSVLQNFNNRASRGINLEGFDFKNLSPEDGESQFKKKSPIINKLLNAMSQFSHQMLPDDNTDSDYSFDSDTSSEENEDVNPFSFLLHRKPKTKNKTFTEDIYKVSDELTCIYKSQLEYVKTPVESNNLDNLKFLQEECAEVEHEVPFTQIKRWGSDTIYQDIQAKYGTPRCIKLCNNMDQVVIGLENSTLILYNLKTRDITELKSSNRSAVNCIDFTENDNFMIVGLDSAEVSMYRKTMSKNGASTYFREVRLKDLTVLSTKLVAIKALRNFKAFVTVTEDGRIFYCHRISGTGIVKSSWHFRLGEKGTTKFTKCHLTTKIYRGIDFIVQTMGDVARVYVHKYSNKFKGLEKVAHLKCPPGKPFQQESFAFFDQVIDEGNPLKVICIVWGFYVCYYPLLYGKGGMYIPLGGVYEMENKIQSAAQFEKNIFVLIDDKHNIYHYNLQNHTYLEAQTIARGITRTQSVISNNSNNSTHPQQNSGTLTSLLPQTTHSSRTTQDSEHLLVKRDSNATLNPIAEQQVIFEEEQEEMEMIKEETLGDTLFGKYVITQDVVLKTEFTLNKEKLILTGDHKIKNGFVDNMNSQMFFLTEAGFCIYEMYNWIDYVNRAISENKIMFGMKMINFLLDQQDLMLRGIPETKAEILDGIKPLLALLTVKVWPTIDKTEIETIKRTASMSMLLLIKAGMMDYLTDGLKNIMIAFGFEPVYYTYLSSFYQGQLIPKIRSDQLLDMLNYFQNNKDHQRRLLYHAFTYGGLEDYAMQKGLSLKFFFLTTYFGRKWLPEMSIIPLNNMISVLIQIDMNTEVSLEMKQIESTKIIFELMWYVNLLVIRNKKIIGKYTSNDATWQVLNWFFDFQMSKEIMKVNFPKYLVGLDFLLHRHISKELEKLGEDLANIDLEKYDSNPKKGVLSPESNKHVQCLLDTIYTSISDNQEYSNRFFIFLASLMLNESRLVKVSDNFKMLTVKTLVQHFKDWPQNPELNINEDILLSTLLSIFQLNKNLFMQDEEFKSALNSGDRRLQVMIYILKGDEKSTFVHYQRLVEDNKLYRPKLFEWINLSFSNKRERARMIQLLYDEYMYLVSLALKF